MREAYEDDFEAGMGAEAVKRLLEDLDLDKLSEDLQLELKPPPARRGRSSSNGWRW